ncbi:MAG: 3D domain-containing protein [Acidobacteriota bacterium]|jgi:3D (Asp-Asp-Asp) domain-containing protein|nr:3D domain-containing protein [Acidobacteriota bacterium]
MLKDRHRLKMILKRIYWPLVRVPLVVAGFACLLCYYNHRENARMDVAMKAVAPVAASPAASPEVELLEAKYETPELTGLTDFHATAYCIEGITRSGEEARHGYVAADLRVLPLGSLIYVESPLMGGVYQVMDSGAKVKGRIIDIFLPGYERCKIFGRRIVKVQVLRYGFAKNAGR